MSKNVIFMHFALISVFDMKVKVSRVKVKGHMGQWPGLEFTAFPGKVKFVAERQKLEGGFPKEGYLFKLYWC